MICPKCGKRVENDAMFCTHCGEPLPSYDNQMDDCLIPPTEESMVPIKKPGNIIPWILSSIIVILCIIIVFLLIFPSEQPAPVVKEDEVIEEENVEEEIAEEEIKEEDVHPVYYKTNYPMNTRRIPSYNGKKLDTIEKGKKIEVYIIENSTNGSVWGQLEDESWICLKDNDASYCTELN